MIYHPTIIILFLVANLIAFYNRKNIFNIISLLIPIIASYILYILPETNIINVSHITLIYEGSSHNKLIGFALLLVLFTTNLYAISNDKKAELVLGNSYAAFSFFSLLAGDFLSILIGLELMMISSSFIIFVSNTRDSLRCTKKYFMTHLLSGGMIMIGVAHLITQNNDLTILSLSELLNNPEYSKAILYIMLFGMLINIAIFPFSGWMVSYYPQASPTGFLYLISFTTKISIFLLIKLFAGYEPLKYMAITMILYAVIKAIFENNMLRLLCYFSIIVMGLILLGVSSNNPNLISYSISYLFVHIIYKSLLSLSVVTIIDNTGIHNCSELKIIKSKFVLASLIIGIIFMINVPFAASFYIKSLISKEFYGTYIYFIIMIVGLIKVSSLPLKQYFTSKDSFDFEVNIHTKIGQLLMIAVLIITSCLWSYLPILSSMKNIYDISLFDINTLKQIILIVFGMFIANTWQTERKNTKPINFVETIALFISNYNILEKEKQNNIQEPVDIEPLEKQTNTWFKHLHNQQTAIFIVFSIFIIILAAIKYSELN